MRRPHDARRTVRSVRSVQPKLTILFFSGCLTLFAAPAPAHHSFAAEFDATRPVTLTGTMTRMEWANPHGWIYIDVKGPDGKVENWAIEGWS